MKKMLLPWRSYDNDHAVIAILFHRRHREGRRVRKRRTNARTRVNPSRTVPANTPPAVGVSRGMIRHREHPVMAPGINRQREGPATALGMMRQAAHAVTVPGIIRQQEHRATVPGLTRQGQHPVAAQATPTIPCPSWGKRLRWCGRTLRCSWSCTDRNPHRPGDCGGTSSPRPKPWPAAPEQRSWRRQPTLSAATFRASSAPDGDGGSGRRNSLG